MAHRFFRVHCAENFHNMAHRFFKIHYTELLPNGYDINRTASIPVAGIFGSRCAIVAVNQFKSEMGNRTYVINRVEEIPMPGVIPEGWDKGFNPLANKIKTNEHMDNVTISKDRIKEAASKCPTAAQTLKVLFPEVFEDDKKVIMCSADKIYSLDGKCLALVSAAHQDSAIYLNGKFDWEFKRENFGCYAIPTKK